MMTTEQLMKPIMKSMPCTICGSDAEYRVRYPERRVLTDRDFSARKTPSRKHFRMVECKRCSLIYSNPVISAEEIVKGYEECEYLEESQLMNMADDYLTELKRAMPLVANKEALLEVGCANGFLLRKTRELGFSRLSGVEIGKEAVSKAHEDIRDSIINAPFTRDLFAPDSFDVACCFQVFDHLLDPREFIHDVHNVLKPGGLFLSINHNIRSLATRLLGERSPMYDIEHMYLFDPSTMKKILEENGFRVESVRGLWNRYDIEYVLKMFPFPDAIRQPLLKVTRRFGISQKTVRLAAGNIVTVGVKV